MKEWMQNVELCKNIGVGRVFNIGSYIRKKYRRMRSFNLIGKKLMQNVNVI